MTTTIERLRELAEAGLPAGGIAKELGISRQRVYQIVKKHGISVASYHQTAYRFEKGSPRPRLLTGGVPVKISHSAAGMVSELLAAADLMARGWHVFMPVNKSRGHDLVAAKGDALITIEVRSAHRNASNQLRYSRKAECKSQYHALVVTGEPVQYEPALPE